MLFPAHAGVFPPPVRPRSADHALPRARGGISGSSMAIYTHNLFPAHAGVFPIENDPRTQPHTLPRARGGISGMSEPLAGSVDSSPRTRRYFRSASRLCAHRRLFPAHAGVFPDRPHRRPTRWSLPRARGGISRGLWRNTENTISSPRTRGYFRGVGIRSSIRALFPAHAGVFPYRRGCHPLGSPLPRARGGSSATGQPSGIITTSSPRTRGYFWLGRTEARHGCLFPAHAGVFPVAPSDRAACVPLPRARGGISVGKNVPAEFEASSPRTRGYFPLLATSTSPSSALPRARGGISGQSKIHSGYSSSSPRTRGYFRTRANILDLHLLFPAHAGVLRTGAASNQFPNAYLIPTNGSALVWI